MNTTYATAHHGAPPDFTSLFIYLEQLRTTPYYSIIEALPSSGVCYQLFGIPVNAARKSIAAAPPLLEWAI